MSPAQAPRSAPADAAGRDAPRASPLTVHEGGPCTLLISVQPNAKRTTVDGLHDGALRVRLVAPPVDGKANAALLGWLAASLGLPKRALSIRQGETSRRKVVAVDAPPEHLKTWLATMLAPPGDTQEETSP